MAPFGSRGNRRRSSIVFFPDRISRDHLGWMLITIGFKRIPLGERRIRIAQTAVKRCRHGERGAQAGPDVETFYPGTAASEKPTFGSSAMQISWGRKTAGA